MPPRRIGDHPRRLAALSALVVLLASGFGSAAAAPADARDRVLDWSGYRWTVRQDKQRSDPGNNRWGNSRAHARVQSDGTLRLDIVRGRSVELVGPPTSYGRYRWVVEGDLSRVSPFRVVALFVRGTRGEQDIEFSRWGEALRDTAGSWVTWQRGRRRGFGFFGVSPLPPYTVEIDWRVGAARFRVTDAAGTRLLDRRFAASGGGRHMAPRVSYWLYPGHGTWLSPFTRRTPHPALIVRSFRFKALPRHGNIRSAHP